MIGKTNANITINNSSSSGSSSENQYVPQEPAGYEINTKVFKYEDKFESKYKYNFTTKQFYPVDWEDVSFTKAPLTIKNYKWTNPQWGGQENAQQRLQPCDYCDEQNNKRETIYNNFTSIPKDFGDGITFYDKGFDINSCLKTLFSTKFLIGTIREEYGSIDDNSYFSINLGYNIEIKKENGTWKLNEFEYIADKWKEKIVQSQDYLYIHYYSRYYVMPEYNEYVRKIKWWHMDEDSKQYKVVRVSQSFVFDKNKNLIIKTRPKINENGEYNVYDLNFDDISDEDLKNNYSLYFNDNIGTQYADCFIGTIFDLINTSLKTNDTLYPVFTDNDITKNMENVIDYSTLENENSINYEYGSSVRKGTLAQYFLNSDGNINYKYGDDYNNFILSMLSLTYELNKTYTTHFVFSFDQTKDNDGNETNHYDRSGSLFESRVYNKDFHRSWNDEQQKDMIKLQNEEIYLEYNKKYVIELSLTPTHIDTSNGRQELKIKIKWILKDYTTNESLYIYTNEDRDYDSYDLDSDDYNKAPFGFAIIPYKNLTIYGRETYFAIDGEKKYLVVAK